MTIAHGDFVQDYFSANNSLDRGWLKNSVLAVLRTTAESPSHRARKESVKAVSTIPETLAQTEIVAPEPTHQILRAEEVTLVESVTNQTAAIPEENVLPHRRRKRRKDAEHESPSMSLDQQQLPLDASSQLTTAAASLPASAHLRQRLLTYLSLSKPRLSFLILLTTTCSYSLYPLPDILSSTPLPTPLSTSTLTFLFLTSGTFLSCASANTLNMLFEPRYDALMSRTRNRPLVRGLISLPAAAVFALVTGVSGLTLLYFGTNPTVSALSALNIFLYAGVYTPLKRISPINTWIGAIVGGIPPLMGWCAAAGQAATSEHHSWQDLLFSESSVGGWALAALLFAWQFPHFMSLSHTIRDDYKNAGHKMLAWTNPARNARVALRYSVLMFPICFALYSCGVVNEGFLAISTLCNAWMLKEAVRFWKYQGGKGSARGLFWASVWQLPLVLVGALVCKSGIWSGVFGEKEQIDMPVVNDEDVDQLPIAEKAKHELHKWNMSMMGFKRPS